MIFFANLEKILLFETFLELKLYIFKSVEIEGEELHPNPFVCN